MPAQTTNQQVPIYGWGDTAPPLYGTLQDGDGNPIDLTGATVTITIAYQTLGTSFYYSPSQILIDGASATVDPDQVTNTGLVYWAPQAGDLEIAGNFRYRWTVTYADSSVQSFPSNTYLPLIVTSPTGGNR